MRPAEAVISPSSWRMAKSRPRCRSMDSRVTLSGPTRPAWEG